MSDATYETNAFYSRLNGILNAFNSHALNACACSQHVYEFVRMRVHVLHMKKLDINACKKRKKEA